MYQTMTIVLGALLVLALLRNLFKYISNSPTNPQSIIEYATRHGLLSVYSDDVQEPVVEHFFDNGSGDWELVRSTLNDKDPVVGTGSGITDMFDYSNRFIDSQFEASHIPYIPQQHVLPGPCSQCR
jgi:hypothetical protein